MKNLANCKPSEFLRQSNRIRKHVAKWLDVTGVMELRNVQPKIPDDATEEEIRKLSREQARRNISAMFDSALEAHPDETLELLGLVCFVEPEDVDNHTVAEYLVSFTELMNDNAVIDFFISLMSLDTRLGLT